MFRITRTVAGAAALVASLAAAQATPERIRAATAKVDGAMIVANAKTTRDWPSYGLNYAENRFSQLLHWRRRRITAPSSPTRLSITLVSVCRQNGQCICARLLHTSCLPDGTDSQTARGWGRNCGDPGENLLATDPIMWKTTTM